MQACFQAPVCIQKNLAQLNNSLASVHNVLLNLYLRYNMLTFCLSVFAVSSTNLLPLRLIWLMKTMRFQPNYFRCIQINADPVDRLLPMLTICCRLVISGSLDVYQN